jgi:serine/threonine-protein kinase
MRAAWTYSMCRRFSTALKLYARALDITPNDQGVMAAKASIYQAQGNLQEAARLLSEVNAQTSSGESFLIKIGQLRLERNYGEAIRLLQARLAQPRFDSEGDNKVVLALMQRLGGDTTGAKATAEQARNALEQRYKDQKDDAFLAAGLSQALSRTYAVLDEKDSALKAGEQAILLLPRDKDRVSGPAMEENLAFIQAIFGEHSHPISILTQLLQMPYNSWVYGPATITPALLRLDPMWDPLRADPAFQKLCEEKQP